MVAAVGNHHGLALDGFRRQEGGAVEQHFPRQPVLEPGLAGPAPEGLHVPVRIDQPQHLAVRVGHQPLAGAP